MNRKFLFLIILLVLVVIILSVILALIFSQQSSNQAIEQSMDSNQIEQLQQLEQIEHSVFIGGEEFMVELADTPAKRARGLSGRNPLPSNQGMLFVYEKAGIYSFWMKEMKFSLDIIWIADNKVVAIWANATVPDETGIPRFTPDLESNYVLEVNAGLVERSGLKVGDSARVDIYE